LLLYVSPAGRAGSPGGDPHYGSISVAGLWIATAARAPSGLSPSIPHGSLSDSGGAGRIGIYLHTFHTPKPERNSLWRGYCCDWRDNFFSSLLAAQRVAIFR